MLVQHLWTAEANVNAQMPPYIQDTDVKLWHNTSVAPEAFGHKADFYKEA